MNTHAKVMFEFISSRKTRSSLIRDDLDRAKHKLKQPSKSSYQLPIIIPLLLLINLVIIFLCEAAPSSISSNHHVASSISGRQKRAATARLDRLWDDAVIPYEIDPIFNDERASLFRAAMRHWENHTCIKFVEKNPEEHRNYIVFTERSCGCCSFVGKRGNGAQAISIGKHCDKFGIVVHELGHVVGFWHEHTRPDRDQHVQIIGKNIMSGQEYNFNKLTKDEVNSLGLAYDYDSILHYATNTFAKDTYLDTILPLHGHLNTEEVTSQTPINHHQYHSTTSTSVILNSSSNAATISSIGNPNHSNNQHHHQQTVKPPTQTSSNSTVVVTSPHMINDEAQTAAAIRRQVELDFQSMLQFNGTNRPLTRSATGESSTKRQRSQKGDKVILLDGSVVVSLAFEQAKPQIEPSRVNEQNRKTRGVTQVDVDDGEHMISTDNMLAKTRPEIGQRVRLSVGDIAQTNLLYKCPKCGQTIQQLSGMFHSPHYYMITGSGAGEGQAKSRSSAVDEQLNQQEAQRTHHKNDICEWRLSVGQGERIMINIADLDIAKRIESPLESTMMTTTTHHRVLGLPRGARQDSDDNEETRIWDTPADESTDPMIMSNCRRDYLEIKDGYSKQAPVIVRLCGHISALKDVIRPIVSTSNRLLVTYRTSNQNNNYRGFLAHHETICGGLIMLGNAAYDQTESSNPSVIIQAGRDAAPDPTRGTSSSNTSTRDTNHKSLINGTSPTENEVLLSSQTNVRYNGPQAQQPSIHINRSQHHHQQPTTTTQSVPPSTTTTAASTSSSTSSTKSDPNQHKSFFNSNMWPVLNSSIIQSPNWPEQYRPSRECLWQIKAEENHQISMRFDTFDLEPHDSCAYDYVEIRDGDSAKSDLLGRFCGNRVPNQVLSSSSSMFVKFVSDSDVNKGGFFASVQSEIDECKLGAHGCSYKCSNAAIPYRCECPNGLELAPDGKNCIPTCGGVRNESTGQITSPSFPDLYPISTRCVWEIVAPPQHRVTLNFTYFDLEGIRAQECDYDFVEVWSKTPDGKYLKNGIYCGLNQPFSVTSIANLMRIEFNSDNSIQKSGFEANYFIDRDECSTNNGGCQHVCKNTVGSYQCSCNNGFILHENKHHCIGSQYLQRVTNPDGTFHSPNFPSPYQPNKEYAWIFSTAPGHRIKLVFDQFDLESHQECAYDHVAVFDGEGVDDHALGRFCGSRRPLTLVSSFNALYLIFRSDATNEKRGFNATHSTICGGRLQANLNQVGFIYSHPQFDGTTHYDRNEDCDWIIEANENQRVRIEFTFFSLEADVNCNYDQTTVYDGSDESPNQLARLCGSDIPKEQMKMTSSGESILIVFKSDDSINGKGFSLTYTAIEANEEETLAISYAAEAKHQPLTS